MEVWKDITGYEGLYQVSNLGRVRSLIRNKVLKPANHVTINGYQKVSLYKNNKLKTMQVHRLVAEAFILDKTNFKSMPDEDRSMINLDALQVNHKDENKQNNCVNNLEWCTQKYNTNYGTKQDRESKIKTKYHVLQYDLDGNLIRKWENLREIVLNTDYNKSNIMYCCQKKYKTAYGYKWEYLVCSR